MQICQNIRQLRVLKKMKPEEVALKVGVARTTYNNWEKETEPSVTIIKSLAEVFEVHYTQIIDGIAADFSLINSLTQGPRKTLTTKEISEALYILADAVNSIETASASEPSGRKSTALPDHEEHKEEFLGKSRIHLKGKKKVYKKDISD